MQESMYFWVEQFNSFLVMCYNKNKARLIDFIEIPVGKLLWSGGQPKERTDRDLTECQHGNLDLSKVLARLGV